MKSISVPKTVYEAANSHLRLCVLGSDPAHQLTAFANCEWVQTASLESVAHGGPANFRCLLTRYAAKEEQAPNMNMASSRPTAGELRSNKACRMPCSLFV